MGLLPPDNWKEPEPIDWDDFGKGLEELARRSIALNRERAVVIVSTVQLEELLRNVLLDFMIDESASIQLIESVIDTFGARINLSFCLGLLSLDETNDLNVIRKIRNHFAHSKDCSFKDQKIVDLSKNFKIPKQRPDLFSELSGLELFEAVTFVLTENLGSRSWSGKKRRCVIPNEIDSKKWAEFF